ncbi:MAG TPA: serine/threonine-protein kinase, partial [Ilumatobacteraceae bacterium]
MLALLDEDGRTSLLDRDVSVIARDVVLPPRATSFEPERFHPYRLRRPLGEGGMGVVYLAERTDLGSLVAIKILRDGWLSPARRERFADEQRILAHLNHPSIARLYDADTLPDGTPWFAMEYVEGVPLTEYCRNRQVSVAERLALFGQVCEAVQYAHRQMVVHRDLKPSNILVTRDGAVKLLDFGIAKPISTEHDDLTRTGPRLMTLAYAAPEQIRGGITGVATDVYALGVILYELLAGRTPFDLADRTPAEVERLVTDTDPLKPSSAALAAARKTAGPSAWADLDTLCLTAMRKDPDRRYGSVEALHR